MIAGANKNDYHLRHVTPGEDFEAEFHDLRQAAEGVDRDGITQTVHIFKLGYKYSKSMGLHVTNESVKRSRRSWAATESASSGF